MGDSVQVLNTTLVLGPYDWHPEVLPAAEFEARVAAARQVMKAQGLGGLVIYGDTFDHGALSYLTGFTPKLGPAFAFFPAEGKPSILFSGGAMIVEVSKKLTWVEEVRAIRDLEKDLASKLREMAAGRELALGLWQSGSMSHSAHQVLMSALGPTGRIVDVQQALENLRRRKSPVEQASIKRACAILAGAVERLRGEFAERKGARSAALAAEREAYSRGAQDARVMASARDGGPPLPLDNAEDVYRDPLLAALAVRYAGYWAEAHVTLGSASAALQERARTALRAMIAAARPGSTTASLGAVVDQALPPARRNPDQAVLVGVGLSLAEAPCGSPETTLAEGDVCCFKVDAVDSEATSGADARAITSAMVMVRASGAEVVWSDGVV
jgi:Xaa-Pro aminopeptidase